MKALLLPPQAIKTQPRKHTGSQGVETPGGTPILVVDDSETNILIAQTYLERAGYRVEPAVSGEEAIEKLTAVQESPFRLVLMDVRMPGIGGLEATRRLREAGSRIPIVALTAHALRQERLKCLEAGMQDFLTKPIVQEELLSCVGHWLEQELPALASTSSGETPSEPAEADLPAPAEAHLESDENTDPVFFDGRALEQLEADTSKAAVERMLAIYLRESERRTGILTEGLDTHEWEPLEVSAHALKGSSLTFGAVALHELAKGLETACQERSEADFRRFQHKLAETQQLTVKALRHRYSLEGE